MWPYIVIGFILVVFFIIPEFFICTLTIQKYNKYILIMQVFILQLKTKLVLVPPFFKPIAPFGWSKSCKQILLILCKSLISPSCCITLSKNTPHPKQPVPVRLPELLIRGQCFLTQLLTFAQCYLPFVGVWGGVYYDTEYAHFEHTIKVTNKKYFKSNTELLFRNSFLKGTFLL